jgi:hypothetical protein
MCKLQIYKNLEYIIIIIQEFPRKIIKSSISVILYKPIKQDDKKYIIFLKIPK